MQSCRTSSTPPGTTSPQPQGFTPVIDWFTTFPFQESLSGLSTQLTFPRTLPIPIFMFLDSWPIFPVCNRDLEASSFKGNVSVREDSFYPDKETYRILICSTKGLFFIGSCIFMCININILWQRIHRDYLHPINTFYASHLILSIVQCTVVICIQSLFGAFTVCYKIKRLSVCMTVCLSSSCLTQMLHHWWPETVSWGSQSLDRNLRRGNDFTCWEKTRR